MTLMRPSNRASAQTIGNQIEMAEEQNTAASEPQTDSMQFQLQKLYVKDASFECPNAPEIFQDSGQAEIKMNLSQRVNDISEGVYEVLLTVTVTAVAQEKTAYLAEVQQAGLFMVQGFNEQAQHAVLNTLCPHTLFPYASRVITDLVADGGFPPLVLQPINFDQVYAQRLAEAGKQQAADAPDVTSEPQGSA